MDERQHTPERCSKRMMRGYHSVRCQKPATVERDGQHYCTVHDPVRRTARIEAKVAAWDAKSKSQEAQRRRIETCLRACEGLADPQATITALVTALNEVDEWDSLAPEGLPSRITKQVRAAVALVPPAGQGEK